LYLNWRYTDHPTLSYKKYLYKPDGKIEGFLVARIETPVEEGTRFRIARIIDFVVTDEAEEPILAAYLTEMKRQKVDMIDFFFSGDFHTDSLKKVGFVENTNEGFNEIPMLFNPIDRRRSNINLIGYSKDEVLKVSDVYVTKGDGDQDRPN